MLSLCCVFFKTAIKISLSKRREESNCGNTKFCFLVKAKVNRFNNFLFLVKLIGTS